MKKLFLLLIMIFGLYAINTQSVFCMKQKPEPSEVINTTLEKSSETIKTLEFLEKAIDSLGMDVNTCFTSKCTLLYLATAHGLCDLVKRLLQKDGIDVNAENERNFPALYPAIRNANEDLIKLLLENEATPISLERLDKDYKDIEEDLTGEEKKSYKRGIKFMEKLVKK